MNFSIGYRWDGDVVDVMALEFALFLLPMFSGFFPPGYA